MSILRLNILSMLCLLILSPVQVAHCETPVLELIKPVPANKGTDTEDPNWGRLVVDYDGGDFLNNMQAALNGDVLAMSTLMNKVKYWGDMTAKNYSQFPPQVNDADYWRAWADRYTSPGWRMLREGDAEFGQGPIGYYRTGAEAGNAEAMWKYAKVGLQTRSCAWLQKSVARGEGQALYMLSRVYSGSKYWCKVEKDEEKALTYILRGAAAGNLEALHALATMHSDPKSKLGHSQDLAYIYTYIGVMLAHNKLIYFELDHAYFLRRKLEGYSFDDVQLAKLQAQGDAWVAAFRAEQDKELEKQRVRRAALTEELRKELAVVVEYIAQRKAAAKQ